MTPEQKLKWMCIAAIEFDGKPSVIDASNVDEVYEALDDDDDGSLQDAREEIREGDVETGLQTEWSRHYESKAVAAQAPDGTWVGWTYWYGGGKHGDPQSIEWMDEAYNLNCAEEEKLVTVRTFTKAETA